MIEIHVGVLLETELALYVDYGADRRAWLPKSLLKKWPDEGDFGDVTLPEWLAIDKGMV